MGSSRLTTQHKQLLLLGLLLISGCRANPSITEVRRLNEQLVFASNRAHPPEAFDLFYAPLGPETETTAPIRLTHAPGHELDPAVSPDGSQLLYVARPVIHEAQTILEVVHQSESSLIVIDLETGARVTVFQTPGIIVHPAWSPDGQRVVFSTLIPGPSDTLAHRLHCHHFARGRTREIGYGAYPSWMPDSRHILVTELPLTTGQARLAVVNTDTGERSGYSQPGPHAATPHPEGGYLAVAVPEGRDGRPTIIVYPTDAHSRPNRQGVEVSFGTASNAASLEPRWLVGAADDGTSLVAYTQAIFDQEPGSTDFLSRIMAVPPEGGAPRELIPADAQNLLGGGYMTTIWLRR